MIVRRLKGLIALLVILTILIGLPVVLLAVGPNPFASIDSADALVKMFTSPDDGTLFLALIKLVGWIAWLVLATSLLTETVARIRGIQAPQLPGLRMPQGVARRLIGATMLLFVAVPGIASTAAAQNAVPPATITIASTPVTPASSSPVITPDTTPAATARPVAPALPATPPPPVTTHTVVRGESLWSIAELQLGDGHRYAEIVELNQQLLAGRASFIRPGWVLTIPAPTPPPTATPVPASEHNVVVQKGDTLSGIARDELGDPNRYGEIFEASRHITQPGGAHLTDPDVIDVGWTVTIPGATPAPASTTAPPVTTPPSTTSTPLDAQVASRQAAQPAPATSATPTSSPTPSQGTSPSTTSADAPTPVESDHDAPAWTIRTPYGVGAILAAGVLAVLAARRRTQQRRRRPGQRMPLPTGEAASLEQELRATADPMSVETVDGALRCLAQACAGAGQPLPVVRAARLTATQFDLYLADPAVLPAPWAGTGDDLVWTIDVDATGVLDTTNAHTLPAPYPSLVTIGHDEDQGHVLLNLEHIGVLGIAGAEAATREILAALAIELATSAWADDIQVTLVGSFPELEDALRTGRIRYLPSVGRILDELLARADQDREALAGEGVEDLHTARVTGAVPDAWTPEILLVAGEITEQQREQLTRLVDDLPHVALAAVTSGSGVGEWAIDLTSVADPDHAVLLPIGLQLQPQRLPADQYRQLLQVVSLADVDELDGAGVEDPSVAEVEGISPVGEPSSPVSLMPEVTLEMLTPAGEQASATAVAIPDQLPNADQGAERVDSLSTAPRVLVLGPVDIREARGPVEPSRRERLVEFAAYLALHPGATHRAIDDAIWPDRKTEDNLTTRNPATTKLRRWLGANADGQDYLPRHQAGEGYALQPSVTVDAVDWDGLLEHDPINCTTERLEQALALVRGIPFEGAHPKRYAWAEPIKQRLIGEIVDASYELARRRLMEGRWRAAEQAVVVGLRIEPAQESLWRLRILAAHESRSPELEAEAIERLLTITDQLECDLEPETEQLLAAIKNPGAEFDRLVAHAL